MNFTIRHISACVEQLIPADEVRFYGWNHTEPTVPPGPTLVYVFNGKEDMIEDGTAYVMNLVGKTVAKYQFNQQA
jgi:hypothetical protein